MVSTSSPPVRRIDYLLLLDTAPPDDASLLRLNSALLLSPSRHPHPRYYTALEQETIHASSLILPYTAYTEERDPRPSCYRYLPRRIEGRQSSTTDVGGPPYQRCNANLILIIDWLCTGNELLSLYSLATHRGWRAPMAGLCMS